MITRQLLHPESIVVVGASNNIHKPGGAVLRNLIQGGFKGELRAVNPKEKEIQGVRAYPSVEDIPATDLAVLAIPAPLCPEAVELLASQKQTKAFIVFSAGFGEETQAGAALEERMVDSANRHQASLIGPNCIGLMNTWHPSVFSQPVPTLSAKGADLISSSGATAVFILGNAVTKGLQFNSVWSVGNGRQIGVEDVLEYLDTTYEPTASSAVKLLYIESIADPKRLLKHAASLIRKGCRIAAVKAGSSECGSRAASSHTGAIASPDAAVDALFRKAGIVRCFSREELVTVGCIFSLPAMRGRNVAVVTHAGGPGVMLADALSRGGVHIPPIEAARAETLKQHLFPGAAVGNPIDFLATGTPEQLAVCMDFCERELDEADAIVVILGTPGLTSMFDMYRMLDEKIRTCSKPVFPVLASPYTAAAEVDEFLRKGNVAFTDETLLGEGLARVLNTPHPAEKADYCSDMDVSAARGILDSLPSGNGYIDAETVHALLEASGVPVVEERVSSDKQEVLDFALRCGFPVVAKAVGIVHKSDVGGVCLNIPDEESLAEAFDRLMELEGCRAVLVQPMLDGLEFFVGAKYEPGFGSVMLCGLGGIYVEVLQDVAKGLAPLSKAEALRMIRSLRCYPMIQGVRGRQGTDEEQLADMLVRLSVVLEKSPEIQELDINPLLCRADQVVAVDARIRIEK